MIKKEIILNCMPPFGIESPSPAMSILKAYLCKYGHTVKVIYWNLLLYNLETEFICDKRQTVKGEFNATLLYAAYLAVKTQNISLYNEVKVVLQTIVPIMLNENNFYDEHINEYVHKLDDTINTCLDNIDLNKVLYFGFSMKLDQWGLATVIAKKIKQRKPDMSVVVGGINTAEIAKAFLDNFKQFDFAVYGEGEIPLENITQFLSTDSPNFSEFNVDRTYYRAHGEIKKSTAANHAFLDLSEDNIYPVFDDYFPYRKQSEITTHVFIPIEGGRGCHWNKCHFCYLNKGYKYRQKDISKIAQEIRYVIAEYNILMFEFLDNDIIGNDMDRFDALLNELIQIKQEYPDFTIIAVEIITLDLSYKIIKKMAEAGITNIQIGYESASHNLLKKIEKKNSFASNLNTIKHCLDVGIRVSGANVLCNLLEETDEDIYEAIENLRFFRFLIETNKFFFAISALVINSSSKYFNVVSKKRQEYYLPNLTYLYQKAFINSFNKEAKWHFFEFVSNQRDVKWNYFTDIQAHYLKNKYEYEIMREDNKIIYQEQFNEEAIEQIEFDKDDIKPCILGYCYDKAISIIDLHALLLKNNNGCGEIDSLKSEVDWLFSKGLLYRTPCYNEIVSVIKITT